MTITGDYASYLVRIWREPLTDLASWRSQVTHIQSGTCWGFDSMDDLQAFLGQQLQESHTVQNSDRSACETA